MWAGTETAGVMRIARQGFLTYGKENGLKGDHIDQILEDRSGEVLTMTEAGVPKSRQISIFDGAGFRSFVPGVLNSEGAWGWQSFFFQAKSGEWWGATEHGLVRFPPMKATNLATAMPIRYPGHAVFHLFEESSGTIWASAYSWQGAELIRWDPSANAVVWFRADGRTTDQPCLFDALVTALAEDRTHAVWMGLRTGGLIRYFGGRFARFGEREGIPPGFTRSLLVDHRGRLWIATNSGGLLVLADPADPHPHFEVYNKARGLSSNSILCIVEDAIGKLYLGTARGVDRLDPETGHVRHFSSADGVPWGAHRRLVTVPARYGSVPARDCPASFRSPPARLDCRTC
jgi:ligand-binding sensor domain-containing protein